MGLSSKRCNLPSDFVQGGTVDNSVIIVVVNLVILLAWWFVDIKIDQRQMRFGLAGSWVAGALLTLLLAVSSFVTIGYPIFLSAMVLSLVGLSYSTIYWLRIRRPFAGQSRR